MTDRLAIPNDDNVALEHARLGSWSLRLDLHHHHASSTAVDADKLEAETEIAPGHGSILGGALLLRAIKAPKVYQEIDGSLLLIFAGLFVVVAAAEKVLLTPDVVGAVQAFHFANVYVLTADTAVLSNIISNVPAVLGLKPFVLTLADQDRVWLVIAMSATLAGNLTPVGSVANLIVAERARAVGIHISFWTYCSAGIPITIATLAIGAWWLR